MLTAFLPLQMADWLSIFTCDECRADSNSAELFVLVHGPALHLCEECLEDNDELDGCICQSLGELEPDLEDWISI